MSEYYNCNPKECGKPLCRLPEIINDYKLLPIVQNPQVMGARGDEVKAGRRKIDLKKNQFDVFVIGDYPGRREDRENLPFTGPVAKILCEFLQKANFDLSKVYITNQVKCTTPNRKATAGEKQACTRHLQYEFEKYQPKVVILLGNETLKLFNLDKEGGMRKIHGKIFTKPAKFLEESPDFIVIPTYGPGYFVQREEPKLQRRVLDDYVLAFHAAFSDLTTSKPHYVSKFKLCETIADVEEMTAAIKANGVFSWDTESPNSQWWKMPLITAQFSIGKDKNWVLPFYRHDPDGIDWKLRPQWTAAERLKVNSLLSSFFSDEEVTKVAHYAHYDINVIRKHVGCEVNGWVWDTMIVHRLLKEDPPHDLEYLADTHYGTGDYSHELHQVTGKGKKLKATYDNVPDHILHPYGSNDVELCYRLNEEFYGELCRKPHLLDFYREEVAEAIYNFADIEWVGQTIDVDVTKEILVDLDKEIDELLLKCRELSTPNFNPGSHDQVAKELVKMGHADKIRAPKKAKGYKTDKATLEEIDREEVPFVGLIVDYRNRDKMRSTYAMNILESVHTDGRGRFSFKPFGTVGGRASAKIVHQIPKNDKKRTERGQHQYRDMFIEDPGYVYYYFDFSQIELWVFALIAGEEKLLEKLRTGDPHRAAAAACMQVPEEMVSDFNRTEVGKRVGFGTIYGSEGHKLTKSVYENPRTGKIEVLGDRAYEFVENYMNEFTCIRDFISDTPDFARANNCTMQSVFGLERRLPQLKSKEDGKRKHAEREMVNFLAQSPASSVMMRTMNIVRRVLKEYNIPLTDVRPVNTVHDSGAYGVRVELVEWLDQTVRTIASRPIPELKNHEFKIKAGWGPSWASAEGNSH